MPIYTDPELVAYKALSLKRSYAGAVDPRTLSRIQAYGRGHRQGATKGDVLQLGGVLLVDTAGGRSDMLTGVAMLDHPAMAEVLDAVAS